MQNVFSSSSRVPIDLIVPELFKSPSSKSSLILKANSALSSYRIKIVPFQKGRVRA
jgi:hypothetical protein